ncbi:MAG TPA: TolC family protein, partial [Puia sp.]
MRIIKIITLFLPVLISVTNLAAQDKWDLRRCVEYALTNNISIKQADIDSRTYKLYYDQAKGNKMGALNAATALGLNYGRSINQTTNVYTNTQGLSQYYNLQASVTLFNWFALRRA